MSRIAVGGFHHETNCFVPVHTDLNYFATVSDRPPLSRGDEVLRNLPNKAFGMSGFIADMMGINAGACRMRLLRARQLLRTMLPLEREEWGS